MRRGVKTGPCETTASADEPARKVTRRYESARELHWQKLPPDPEAGTDKVYKSTQWHEPCFGDKLSQP